MRSCLAMNTPLFLGFSRNLLCGAAVLLVSSHAMIAAPTGGCLQLTSAVASRLADYVAKAYDFAPDIQVSDDGLLEETGFRQITFQVASPRRSLSFFLSPDQQYITPELVNVTRDPSAERARVAMETEKRLLEDHSPSKGAKDAPVTIVEFSDFECPFCKQLAGFIAQAKWSPSDVRVVFKQFPLSMHPWARKAAISASCVGMQSEESFWRLHDSLFENQDAITSGNIDEKLRQYISNDAAIDAAKLDACTNQQGNNAIEKDEMLAEQYQIDATPTIFINGARKAGFRTAEELSTAVEHELQLIKLHGRPASRDVSAETR